MSITEGIIRRASPTGVMLEVFFGELVGDEISGKGKLARVFSLVEIDS